MKITDFIICEDIRHEIGQKISLMGMLNDNLTYTGQGKDAWPKSINLATFIRIAIKQGEAFPNNFNLTVILNDNILANITGDLSVPEKTQTLNVPVMMHGMPLISTGPLKFKIKFKKGKKVLIEGEKTIIISAD